MTSLATALFGLGRQISVGKGLDDLKPFRPVALLRELAACVPNMGSGESRG